MKFYRFVSKKEIERYAKNGMIDTSHHDKWRYPPNTVIHLFRGENWYDLIMEYKTGVVDQRNLKVGDFIYVIEIKDLPEKYEKDKFAAGWPHSYVHYGPIDTEYYIILGKLEILQGGDQIVEVSQLVPFNVNLI
ncbi:MAG: hypothetical protein HQ562_01925 [Candidatus Marinimicrobia bacterium]|nr:hypothetical protein [Candidatus Neomarinimicrobiota bacterium]